MSSLFSMARVPGKLTLLATLLAGLSAPAAAVSPDLVISQIYGGGGNGATSPYKSDYVEIFNRGSAAVSLEGWSLQYASATNAAAWATIAPLPSMVVEPGQYVLLEQFTGSAGMAALPTPLVTGSKINLSATSGKIALVRNTTALFGATPTTPNVVDLLGFGTSNGYEAVAALAGSNTLALLRNAGGCAETDNNRADFTPGAPLPRTSASPRNLCSPAAPVDAPIATTCPAVLSTVQGQPASIMLSASDADSELEGATITAGATAGVALGDFVRGADGKSGSVELATTGALGGGVFPVKVTFTNNTAQSASCTVSVSVEAVTPIPQIQGEGAASPLKGSVQMTTGVVTHVFATGYFIQDAAGDGNPATSDGLFIYTGSTAPAVAVGDLVRVKGTVTEFGSGANTYTELSNIVSTTVLSNGMAIAPTNIEFVGGASLEAYEGMLVNFTNDLTVNQTAYLGTRGELTLAYGRREKATNRYRAGSQDAIALEAENRANQLVLDDSSFTAPATVPYLSADGTVRVGDTVSGLTGVIDFGAIGGGGSAFKLHPVSAPQFSRTNDRTTAPALNQSAYRVASANVLNFFTTFTNGEDIAGATGQGCKLGASVDKANCRGADSREEFIRQRDKVVAQLLAIDADVVGLMEVQNNGDTAVDYLVGQLNAVAGAAADAPLYAYVAQAPVTGTDAVRVAMIYKPSKVKPSGAPLSDPDPINNRPPLAQTFKATNGARFSVIVNHLRAKGSCGSGLNADLGDGQGCHNQTRVLQATRLAEVFIPQVITASGDPDVLVIGDLNAYGAEDPVNVLTASGLVNEIERFVRGAGEAPYSYVFGGESGYLDHALGTASLDEQLAGATHWHTNADEPAVLDYNLDGKNDAADALYRGDAYRSADHDPVVVALDLTPTFVDVTANMEVVRNGPPGDHFSGKAGGAIHLTNIWGRQMTGPFHVVFYGLPRGVTLAGATGMVDGNPYVTIKEMTMKPGEKFTFPVKFNNPNKAAIAYTIKVYTGTF